MRYTVFVAFNVILLLFESVDCKGYRPMSRPVVAAWSGYEDPDIEDDDPCSDEVNTELSKIRADLRAVKSLVEGLRQKLDPDYKPMETEEPTDQPGQCPEGFEYLSEADGCYKAIGQKLEWSSAQERCQSLNPNAHLISIESREESDAVTKYLIKRFPNRGLSYRNRCHRPGQPGGHGAFWTSGQRVNMSDCSSEFVWKTTAVGEAPLDYTQWLRGEPNCWGGDEKCAEILLGRRSVWNDVMCYVEACAVCEYDLS